MNNENSRFKEFDGLSSIIKEIKEDINIDKSKTLDYKDDDFGISFFPDIDYEFLKENVDRFTPESFVYQYCLSLDEREFLDSIREVNDSALALKRTFKD